jgi:probable rRNA maturation factor
MDQKTDNNISVNIITQAKNLDDCNDYEQKIENIARAVCKQFNLDNAAINLVITTDDEITRINQQFLDRDTATDCISFDLSENGAKSQKLFDIIINSELAERQSRKLNVSHIAELALYTVHGLLHNLGFDDDSEENAATMHKKEDQILENQGFGNVFYR